MIINGEELPPINIKKLNAYRAIRKKGEPDPVESESEIIASGK
jgi:hypothetical protein